jgi:hypothetical protein
VLARDLERLGPSLVQFVGHPAYGLRELRGDLERFVFLLGGNDGEPPSSAHDRVSPVSRALACRCEDGGHARGVHP